MPVRWLVVVALGAAGCADEGDQCEQLKYEAETCYEDFCNTSDVPFCGCWDLGMDLNLETCDCVPFDLDPVCDIVDFPVTFDCSVATESLDVACN